MINDQNERMLREVKMSSLKVGQGIRALEEKARVLQNDLHKATGGLKDAERKITTDIEHLNEASALIQRASDSIKDLERKLSRNKDLVDQMKTLVLDATHKYREIQTAVTVLKTSHDQHETGVQKVQQSIEREKKVIPFKKAA